MLRSSRFTSLTKTLLKPGNAVYVNLGFNTSIKVVYNDMGVLFLPSKERNYELVLENCSSSGIVIPKDFQVLTAVSSDDTNELVSCVVYDPSTDISYAYPPSRPYDFR
jgi:hypothetical protein